MNVLLMESAYQELPCNATFQNSHIDQQFVKVGDGTLRTTEAQQHEAVSSSRSLVAEEAGRHLRVSYLGGTHSSLES